MPTLSAAVVVADAIALTAIRAAMPIRLIADVAASRIAAY